MDPREFVAAMLRGRPVFVIRMIDKVTPSSPGLCLTLLIDRTNGRNVLEELLWMDTSRRPSLIQNLVANKDKFFIQIITGS